MSAVGNSCLNLSLGRGFALEIVMNSTKHTFVFRSFFIISAFFGFQLETWKTLHNFILIEIYLGCLQMAISLYIFTIYKTASYTQQYFLCVERWKGHEYSVPSTSLLYYEYSVPSTSLLTVFKSFYTCKLIHVSTLQMIEKV